MNVFVYKWTPKFKDVSDKRNGRCVFSPVFHTMANETFIYWQVEFYPNGCKPLCRDKCSIFLHLVGSNTSYEVISAKFQFELARSEALLPYQTPLSEQHDFIKNKISDTSLCFHRFAPSFTLIQMKDLLLLGEDRILIKCTIELPKATFKTSVNEQLPPPVPAAYPNLESFESLVAKPHDVILLVKGERKFFCHKEILSDKCNHMKHMFDLNDTLKLLEIEEEESEATSANVYTISDIDGNVMMEVLRFLYTDSFDDDNLRCIAAQVLPIAVRYGLNPLRIKCAEFMIETLNRENALDYLILADRFKIEDLKKRALLLIVDELKEIKEEPNWKSFVKNNSTLVEYIFQEVAIHNVLAAF